MQIVKYKETSKEELYKSKQNTPLFLDEVNRINGDCDLNGLMLDSLCNKYKSLSPFINHKENIIRIKGDNYKKLKGVAAKNNLTLHSILQYIWHKIIHLYSNNIKTVAGALVYSKTSSIDGLNKYMGSTLNIFPLIVDHQDFITQNNTLIESIKSIDEAIDKLYEWRNEDFINQVAIDSMLFYEERKEDNFSSPTYSLNATKNPIILKVTAYASQLNINIIFDHTIYSCDRIKDIASIIENLLQIIRETPFKNEKELTFIPQNLFKKVLVDFNKTNKKYIKNLTVHRLFEQQVAKNPKNIAVGYEVAKGM